MGYKTEMMESNHENELLPLIAKTVGVPVSVLVDVGYHLEGEQVMFKNKLYIIQFDQ